MKLNGEKELEKELHLLLCVVCSDCNDDWYPQNNGWNPEESDTDTMIAEYLPKLIELGWYELPPL